MLCVVLAGCGRKEGAADKENEVRPVVEVTLDKARAEDVPVTTHAPATVFAREQANLSARITAPIRRLLARKGDNVRAGQVLAELENRDILAQRAEAQGAVSTAEATLQKTISGTLPSDIERARGQVETTKAALNQTEQLYNRRKSLFAEGAIPQRDLLQTQADYETARANYDVAVRSYDLLRNQQRGRDEQIAKANVEQAQARLQGAVAQLQFTEVRAPFSGTITDQLQYPGDMAQPTTTIFTVADLSAVTARAQVPEAEADAVRKGQACSFQSVDHMDARVSGRVTVVNRAVDLQRRTVEVWCEIAKPPEWVRAGAFGTVTIQTGAAKNAVVIPRPALQQEEGTNQGTVFVVDAKRIAHKREVTVGETVGTDLVQMTGGLKPGETVVVQGAYGLPDNAQVVLQGEKPPAETDKKQKKEEKE